MWWVIIIISVVIVVGVILLLIFLPSLRENDDSSSTWLSPQERNHNEQIKAGLEGEAIVKEHLEAFISFHGGYIFNNFCFKGDNGYSSEIDHILISKGGVFIIETKAIVGTIYGNEEDEVWHNFKDSYPTEKTFRNPVKQNLGHINHLKKLIRNNPPKMQNMVIFLDADLSNIDSAYVFDIESAMEHIRSFETIHKHSDEYIERVYQQIKSVQNIYGITPEEHIDNIKNRYN